jgi:hypothetical protein
MCRNQLYYIHSHIACNNYDKTGLTAAKKIHRAVVPAWPVFHQGAFSSVMGPGRMSSIFFFISVF